MLSRLNLKSPQSEQFTNQIWKTYLSWRTGNITVIILIYGGTDLPKVTKQVWPHLTNPSPLTANCSLSSSWGEELAQQGKHSSNSLCRIPKDFLNKVHYPSRRITKVYSHTVFKNTTVRSLLHRVQKIQHIPLSYHPTANSLYIIFY